jgi:hypothetical protein
MYYHVIYPRLKGGYELIPDQIDEIVVDDNEPIDSNNIESSVIEKVVKVAAIASIPVVSGSAFHHFSPILCNHKIQPTDTIRILGYFFSWTSGLLYFCSRYHFSDQEFHNYTKITLTNPFEGFRCTCLV